jgi:hypothetical protein
LTAHFIGSLRDLEFDVDLPQNDEKTLDVVRFLQIIYAKYHGPKPSEADAFYMMISQNPKSVILILFLSWTLVISKPRASRSKLLMQDLIFLGECICISVKHNSD